MKYIYKHLVFAGTFDRLHIGHKRLLDMAFELAEKVSIGITTEKLYKSKPLANLISTSQVRRGAVEQYLRERKWLKRAGFFELEDIFGPSISFRVKPAFDSILVTELTKANAERINKIRKKKELPLLKIIVSPLVRGDDGEVVTSERIRLGEIDREGHNFQIPMTKSQEKELILPKYLRKELRKPLGLLIKSQIPNSNNQKNPKSQLPNSKILTATAKIALQYINKFKSTMVITVGDIVTISMLKIGFDPDVKIIDLRSRREQLNEYHRFLADYHGSQNLRKSASHPWQSINLPGTININAAELINKAIKKNILYKQQSWIVIKGEEDLLALPSILLAPLHSVVLYGQIDLGVVMVEVTEEKKKQVANILKKFK